MSCAYAHRCLYHCPAPLTLIKLYFAPLPWVMSYTKHGQVFYFASRHPVLPLCRPDFKGLAIWCFLINRQSMLYKPHTLTILKMLHILETLNVTQPPYSNHTTKENNAMSSSSMKIYLSKLLINNPPPLNFFALQYIFMCILPTVQQWQ